MHPSREMTATPPPGAAGRPGAAPGRSALRRALAAISVLWLATAAGAACAFLAQALMARALGPDEYGLFASSLATVSLVAPLAGFGLSQFWLKAYGQEGWSAQRWLVPSLRFTVATTLLALAAVTGVALLGAPSPGTRAVLLLLLPVILGVLAIDLVGSKLRLEERYAPLALWQLVNPAGRLLVAALLLASTALSAPAAALGYGAVSLAIALVALPQLRAMLRGDLALHGHGARPAGAGGAGAAPTASQVWSQAWAFGVAAVLYPVFFQVSTVLLKYLAGDAQAGVYGIALAVMTAIYLIPATIYQKFLLSKLHRWSAQDPAKFWRVYRKGNVAMLLAGSAIGLLLALLGPPLAPLVFGERFGAVGPVLLVLAACPPVRFLSTAVGAALLTERHMRLRILAMGAATVTVVLLNLLLIPRYGVRGAAFATVLGELVLLTSMALGVRSTTPKPA
jgi:O-antigen/teichoic acid export membrane protein